MAELEKLCSTICTESSYCGPPLLDIQSSSPDLCNPHQSIVCPYIPNSAQCYCWLSRKSQRRDQTMGEEGKVQIFACKFYN